MAVKKLRDFLDNNKVKYHSITHSLGYTAQEIAESAHISGKDLAKTVMLKIDGKLAMAVLPASYKIDLELFKQGTGAPNVELAGEEEFESRFPDCDIGAMPPFGNLYGMDVYVAEILSEDDEISFNAGSHSELIRLSYKDYETLVKPKKARFSC